MSLPTAMEEGKSPVIQISERVWNDETIGVEIKLDKTDKVSFLNS